LFPLKKIRVVATSDFFSFIPPAMFFSIRDDDTNYFTSPSDLENAYSEFWHFGPVSISVVPFQKGCNTKGVPVEYRQSGDVYPLEANADLLQYLREKVRAGQLEIMLHGYHHEDIGDKPEFLAGANLLQKALDGKQYLEKLFNTPVKVFVPPHNAISRRGLRAIVNAGLHLGGLSGLRTAWSPFSWRSYTNWFRVHKHKEFYPFVLNMGDHNEVMGNSVTPTSKLETLIHHLRYANQYRGVFCLATHYWEFDAPAPVKVREQLREIIRVARSFEYMKWASLGDILQVA